MDVGCPVAHRHKVSLITSTNLGRRAKPHPVRRSHQPPHMSESPNVAFRLDAESCRILMGRAARLHISHHKLARQYVLEVLQEAEERVVLREKVQELNATLERFRINIAFSVESLLVSAGKVNQSDARNWVRNTFTAE